MLINEVLITLLAAYFLGSIPFALLLGKLRGVDIRQCGSGNIGATNLTRVLGGKWGKLCFGLDFVKGAVPVAIAVSFVGGGGAVSWLPALAAAGAVAGHVWPVWLSFKGGKGVATTLGAILILSPWAVLVSAMVWLFLFQGFRYVSLASIAAALVLPLADFVVARWLPAGDNGGDTPRFALLALLGLFIIWRHRENIQRLLDGTEHRFSRRQKKERSCE